MSLVTPIVCSVFTFVVKIDPDSAVSVLISPVDWVMYFPDVTSTSVGSVFILSVDLDTSSSIDVVDISFD